MKVIKILKNLSLYIKGVCKTIKTKQKDKKGVSQYVIRYITC